MVKNKRKWFKNNSVIRDIYDGKIINDKEAVSKRNLNIIRLKEGLEYETDTDIFYKATFAVLAMVVFLSVYASGASAITETVSGTMSVLGGQTDGGGWRFNVSDTITAVSFTIYSGASPTQCRLYNTTNGLIETITVSGGACLLTTTLEAGKEYKIAIDKAGATYSKAYWSTSGTPIDTGTFTWISGVYNSGGGAPTDNANAFNTMSVTFTGPSTATPTWESPTPNNNTAVTSQATLNASSTTPNAYYTVWFGNVSTALTAVVNNATSGVYTTNVSLLYNITYYYKARAWSSAQGYSTNTSLRQFNFVHTEGTQPMVNWSYPTPENGSTYVSVVLNATSESPLTTFNIYFGDAPDNMSLVVDNSSSGVYVPTFAPYNATYYFTGSAWNETGHTPVNTTIRQFNYEYIYVEPPHGIFYFDLDSQTNVLMFIAIYGLTFFVIMFGLVVNLGGGYKVMLILFLMENFVLLFNNFNFVISAVLVCLSVALFFTVAEE